MSANTIVTTLRTAAVGSAWAVQGVAQFRQNFARSGSSSSHAGQRITAL